MNSKSKRRFSPLVLGIAFGTAMCLGTVVYAAFVTTHAIDQKDKAFSVEEITVKVGDSIEFKNSDAVVHNVFSNTKDMEFDLRTQQPGKSSTVPFTKEGTCEVRCAIHPKMKLIVKVEK